MRTQRAVAVFAAWAALAGAAPAAPSAPAARTAYERAVARERTLIEQATPPSPRLVRRLVAEYETIARRYENTGYADNALWHGAGLAASLYERTRVESDRRAAIRLLQQLVATYPTSSLVAGARPRIRELTRRKAAPAPPGRQVAARTAPATPTPKSTRTDGADAPRPASKNVRADATEVLTPDPAVAGRELPGPVVPAAKVRPRPIDAPVARVVDIRRNALPEVVRVTIELDGEIAYHEERVDNPARLFFDLAGAGATPRFQEGVLSFPDDIVRQVRYGRRGTNTTRVVMDLEGVQRYSVFSLYNPFRIVIDFERAAAPSPATPAKSASAPTPPAPLPSKAIPIGVAPAPVVAAPAALGAGVRPINVAPTGTRGTKSDRQRSERPAATTGSRAADAKRSPVPAEDSATASNPPVAPTDVPAPITPATNASGSFSLARQLGLGVSRIVIDPGHGGHDPGAQGTRLWEAELVLDVALRLENLLLQQPGVEVVLTRRTDTFVALEERTAIANRERADLFLSIHANASRNRKARGVETYFLNFASNPQAEEVAARENSASGRTMHNLPDMVRAIALNNKLDESRDLAAMVQRALIRQLDTLAPDTKDLGVKQAPFVVLIGAQMPSVLAEISFITNPQEGALLRTAAYRQGIAQALFEAIAKYQRSLKSVGTVAGQ